MTANRFRFRAWDGTFMEYNCYPCGNGAVCSRDEEAIIEASGKPGGVKESDDTCMIWANKPILMQSTGLTDKNGKEIFEGDVIQTEYNDHGIVAWLDGGFVLADTQDDRYSGDCICNHDDVCTVIGNIYENSELIERNES
jgi:uncharacterized phage protein (TIGR01671 family)